MLINRYKLYLGLFMTAFWLACCWGFVADELIPPLHKLDTLRNLVVDGILVVLGLACLRNKFDIAVLLSFIALSVISNFLVNHEGLVLYFNGFRDFVALIFIIPIIRYFLTSTQNIQFKRYFDKTLFIWLCLQAACITWQFLKYGAGDEGGGTLGIGGSGITSMLIYVVSFYLISSRWDSSRYMQSLKENKWYVILLYPSFLNETKVSFILLLAYFFLLLKFDRTLVLRLLYILPIAFIGIIGAFFAYISATGLDAEDMLAGETYNEYLVGVDLDELIEVGQLLQDGAFDDDLEFEHWAVDLPRFAKIGMAMPIISVSFEKMMFGMGIGHFKGWTTGRISDFAEEYQWLIQGTRPELFAILIQLGFLGLCWLLWVLLKLTFGGNTNAPFGMQNRWLIALCLLLIMFYNDSLREVTLCAIFIYILLSIKQVNKVSE